MLVKDVRLSSPGEVGLATRDMAEGVRLHGPCSGAWPCVKNGIFTGTYFYLVFFPEGYAEPVTRTQWKQAKHQATPTTLEKVA